MWMKCCGLAGSNLHLLSHELQGLLGGLIEMRAGWVHREGKR